MSGVLAGSIVLIRYSARDNKPSRYTKARVHHRANVSDTERMSPSDTEATATEVNVTEATSQKQPSPQTQTQTQT